MKKLLMATLAVGMLTVSAPIAAHAAHTSYRGGCGFATLNDTTPGGQLGGQDVWNGEVDMEIIATDSSANKVPQPFAISAFCELLVNGVSQGTVLGPQSGIGFVAAVGQIQFTASTTDIVSLCDNVTVDGESTRNCTDAVITQIIPQPVIDLLDMVINTAIDALNTVNDLLNQLVFEPTDFVTCTALVALQGTVNGLNQPGIAHIDSDGDLHLGGAVLAALGADTSDPDYDLFWDCPPYGV